MPTSQLKETTMDPAKRILLRVLVPDRHSKEDKVRREARKTADLVEQLMGRKPELRFQFIQENAPRARDIDV
jgi:topoisomerase-4 subunit B